MPRLNIPLRAFHQLLKPRNLYQEKMSTASIFTPSCSSSMSTPVLKDASDSLYTARVQFDPTDGKECKKMELDAVYQDTLPSGCALGTVLAIHGSPGSHIDFKYITPLLVKKGIRVIAVNFPGFGHSEDHIDLNQDNLERNCFVQALIDGLPLRERIVFLGHSRGADNAIKLSARNIDRTIGTVLVNPMGLRVNKAIRPLYVLTAVRWVYDKFPFLRRIMEYVLFKSYMTLVGLKLTSGRIAINSLKSMSRTSLGKQQPYMERILDHPHIRVLFMYTCTDFLVEKEISREFAETIKNRKHFNVNTKNDEEDKEVAEVVKKEFLSDTRPVTVEFALDSHFMQKSRARFIAEGIEAICQASLKEEKGNNNSNQSK